MSERIVYIIRKTKRWSNPSDNTERCPYCGINVPPHCGHQCDYEIVIWKRTE
ncbi:MAG: hypothetical protein PHI12_13800 [Dehalococcoidales bacterium]|jgi:hypothetical protein|nr:hypothetical protein [Dehalococcoidales bacterium]